MDNRSLGMLAIAASALSCVPGCSHACTEIGCNDTFVATVKRADGSFPNGTHRVEILADGVTTTCTFTFPLPANQLPSCPAGLFVTVAPAQMCKEIFTTETTSRQCEPIPGQFVETIALTGTPGQVHVWQSVDDAPLLDATTVPAYRSVYPNGDRCPPVCRLAEVSWTLE